MSVLVGRSKVATKYGTSPRMASRQALAHLGHGVTVIPPRTGTFGHGHAVMSDGTGVHYGASEPRHDGLRYPRRRRLGRSG